VRARVLLLLLAASVALPGSVGARPAIVNNGELRILVILATWGPQPFTRDRVQQIVFKDTDAFVRENSYGAAWLGGEVTPWVNAFPSAPRCGTPNEQDALGVSAKAAAKAAGFDPSAYSRFVYIFPTAPNCGYAGYGSLRDVFLNGQVDDFIVAHELGHTFGLSHAHTVDCSGASCQFIEYGDQYDTMGSGAYDYNTYEKHVAGWLTNAIRPTTKSTTYTIEALEPKTSSPEALDVQTARNEFWIDHREPILGDSGLAGKAIVQGVEIHAGPPSSDPTASSDWNTDNTLLPNPGGTGGSVVLPGHSFGEAGAFRITVVDHVGTHVDVRFEWTDTKRPTAPRLDSPGKTVRGRSTMVAWEPATDVGSGLDRYVVTVDGHVRATVNADFTLPLNARITKLTRGTHKVSVVAFDRAGNRGAAATRTFSVR
jgi:hypothetical protein